MLLHLRASSLTIRATAVLAVAGAISGCGTSSSGSPRASTAAIVGGPEHGGCSAMVLATLGRVAMRIYHQGVQSERTGAARHIVAASVPLREAVERGDTNAARAVAQALVAGGHLTNLRVTRGSQVLADVGGPAVAPLRGLLKARNGLPIGAYVTSVWSDEGLLAETDGVTGSSLALRAPGARIEGSVAPPPAKLPPQGTFARHGRLYQYTSFSGEAFPGSAMQLYLLKPVRASAALCGSSGEDTVVNTVSRIASLIYAGEGGGRAREQLRRVQSDQALLQAVAARDPLAAKKAIEGLLTQHIVRVRVLVGGKLLSDVGGPYVLAPVSAPLRLAGRTIGTVVSSIQDDEGYLRLTRRLAGVRVLMYMNGSHLVKNSLGPSPGTVPASGSYEYGGNRYRVYTVNARAFPSGPLTIRVLIPIPYS
jgi:hypothetical protein